MSPELGSKSTPQVRLHEAKKRAVSRTPTAYYQASASELEARIGNLRAEADRLKPSSKQRQAMLKQIAQLRMYADAKRWIELPRQKGID
jgi:uncharacterized small protein (DUF1192 family)